MIINSGGARSYTPRAVYNHGGMEGATSTARKHSGAHSLGTVSQSYLLGEQLTPPHTPKPPPSYPRYVTLPQQGNSRRPTTPSSAYFSPERTNRGLPDPSTQSPSHRMRGMERSHSAGRIHPSYLNNEGSGAGDLEGLERRLSRDSPQNESFGIHQASPHLSGSHYSHSGYGKATYQEGNSRAYHGSLDTIHSPRIDRKGAQPQPYQYGNEDSIYPPNKLSVMPQAYGGRSEAVPIPNSKDIQQQIHHGTMPKAYNEGPEALPHHSGSHGNNCK